MTQPAEGIGELGLARRAGFAMAWGQGGKVVEIALMTAIAIVALRALQPQGFGLYSLLTNLAGTASVLIPIVSVEALGAVLPRFADPRQRSYVFVAVALARLAVIVAASAIVILLWESVRAELGLAPVAVRVLVAAAAYWIVQDVLNSVAAYYQAALDLRRVTLWRTAGQVATLGGLLAIVALDVVTVGSTLAIVSAGYLLALSGLVAGLRATGKPRRPPAERVRFVFGFTRNVWLLSVATLALGTQMYVVLIGAITKSSAEVAFYVAAVAVLGRAQILLLAGWSSLIIPAFGAVYHRDGVVALARAWGLFTKLWLVVAAPTSALMFVLADPLIHVLFGEAYGESASLLRVVTAFGFFAAFLAPPTALGALWALDRQATLVRVRLAITPVSVALAVVLIREYDALGAVIATGVATVLTSAVELGLARRAIRFTYPLGFAAWAAVASATLALPAVIIRPDGPIGLVAAVVLGVTATAVAALAVRPFGRDDREALQRVSPRLADSVLRPFVRR